MKNLTIAILCVLCSGAAARPDDEVRSILRCERLFGTARGAVVSVDRVHEILQHTADARLMYRSGVADAKLIVLVSTAREARYRLARETIDTLGVHGFPHDPRTDRLCTASRSVPVGDSRAGLTNSSVGRIDSITLVEDLGRAAPEVWDPAGRFLTHVDGATLRRTTCAQEHSVILGLVSSSSRYGEWTDDPLGTLIRTIEKESSGLGLPDEAREKLAAIYYVGRPQEVSNDAI